MGEKSGKGERGKGKEFTANSHTPSALVCVSLLISGEKGKRRLKGGDYPLISLVSPHRT
jgi:hypothetical protein